MSAEEEKRIARIVARRAMAFGCILALVCNFLPHDYRVICHAVANVCKGGL